MENAMRMIVMALAGIVGWALLAPIAEATPVPGKQPLGVPNIVPVANGCGIGWHWVPAYRRWDGFWVPGHCVRNW
jgi:hypothetical protein